MPAFNLKPTLRAYTNLAYAHGIVEQPSIPTPLLNLNIQWAFPFAKHVGRGQFNFYPPIYLRRYTRLGVLKVHNHDNTLPAVLAEGHLPAFVTSLLDEGWFARVVVDFFHVHNTIQWRRKHWRHDLLIHGHDPVTRQFHCAVYLANGLFGQTDIPYGELHQAVTSPHARGPGCLPQYRGNSLLAVRGSPSERWTAKLDLPLIRAQLQRYLDSTGLAGIQNPFLAAFCANDSTGTSRAAFGLKAYDELRKYFARACAERRTKVDLRATRLLWEHKSLMRLRLQRLMAEGVPLSPEILAGWDEVERLAQELHLLSFAAQKRNAPQLLAGLPDNLARLATREAVLLTRFLGEI